MEGSLIIELTKHFEPVEDKPGYYWLSKRNYQIISEEELKKAFTIYEEDENLYKLLLSN